MRPPLIRVTDHALVRYLERVHDVPMGELRAGLARMCEPAFQLGASTLVADGHRFIMNNGALITVTKKQPLSEQDAVE